ncbi:MAG: GMC family oxidoreductase N-terminal domain-containing protein [Rhodobacteraceae bacterium]|nr:GMC family oxidoreductase N-terminal domain-containing protein [Paracoccaceae bacterium]
MRRKYDHVVIGSGSAGCVIAARLAEEGSATVLLLEAGPPDRHIHIRMPAALGFLLTNRRFNWFYEPEPEPQLDGRRVSEARGRVLGRSSSIDGMNWVRGNPWDNDNRAALGNAGWSHAGVLPYFRKAETFAGGANACRGGERPMPVETCGRQTRSSTPSCAPGRRPGCRLWRITTPIGRRACTSASAMSATASAGPPPRATSVHSLPGRT